MLGQLESNVLPEPMGWFTNLSKVHAPTPDTTDVLLPGCARYYFIVPHVCVCGNVCLPSLLCYVRIDGEHRYVPGHVVTPCALMSALLSRIKSIHLNFRFPSADSTPSYKESSTNFFMFLTFVFFPVWSIPLMLIFTQKGHIIAIDHNVIETFTIPGFLREWFEKTWVQHFGLLGAIGILCVATAVFFVTVILAATLIKWVVRQRSFPGEYHVTSMFNIRRVLVSHIQALAWQQYDVSVKHASH